MRYPVVLTDNRRYEAGFSGEVTVCDIDGTYLATDLTSLKKALAIPFQFAVDKNTIPGAVSLLRELRHGAGEKPAFTPLYFVSASPPQLKSVLERKMLLDGVEFDGISFKDQLKLALKGRLGELKNHTGYKLTALVEYRAKLPKATRWRLLGDDLESDAEIYTMFADICAGTLRGPALVDAVAAAGADRDVASALAVLADDLPHEDPVAAIYIHRTTILREAKKARDAAKKPSSSTKKEEKPAKHSSFSREARALEDFPARVTVTLNHLQAALHLRAAGSIGPGAVKRVAEELIARGKGELIESTLADAQTRLQIPASICAEATAG